MFFDFNSMVDGDLTDMGNTEGGGDVKKKLLSKPSLCTCCIERPKLKNVRVWSKERFIDCEGTGLG